MKEELLKGLSEEQIALSVEAMILRLPPQI